MIIGPYHAEYKLIYLERRTSSCGTGVLVNEINCTVTFGPGPDKCWFVHSSDDRQNTVKQLYGFLQIRWFAII